jgi:hypothetical protein
VSEKRPPFLADYERRRLPSEDEWHKNWSRRHALAEKDPLSPINDDRLRLQTRYAISNAGLFTREDIREALLPENLSKFRTYRNVGPKTIEELRRYLGTTHDRTPDWDEQFKEPL